MKKILYFVLFIFFMMSCSTGSNRARLIAGDSCQYWYMPTPDSLGRTRYYIYFDRTGKRVLLEERFCDKKVYLYEGGDVYYKPKWALINDSTIQWGISERKLTIISDSIIVTEDIEHEIIDTLFKVMDPHLLMKLQKVQIP